MDEKGARGQKGKKNSAPRVVAWDAPTRIFHWLLFILVTLSFVSGKTGGNAMDTHVQSGLVIFVLLIFRVSWGFAGGRQSRFSAFVRGPAAVFRYAKALLKNDSSRHLGHNPLGGWSILSMLLFLGVQVATGLYANDDIITEGPLYGWVSKATSDWLTRVHKLNGQILIVLVSIHVLAVLFYLFYKRENLITPMITGVKQWGHVGAEPSSGSLRTAALIAGLAAIAVYLLVRYAG